MEVVLFNSKSEFFTFDIVKAQAHWQYSVSSNGDVTKVPEVQIVDFKDGHGNLRSIIVQEDHKQYFHVPGPQSTQRWGWFCFPLPLGSGPQGTGAAAQVAPSPNQTLRAAAKSIVGVLPAVPP
jgi:hypothetical protein